MLVKSQIVFVLVMVRFIWGFNLAPVLAQNIAAREVENPYLKSDVGDWVLMERITPLPSGPSKSRERRTIKSKDASKIVIQYTSIQEDGEERDFYAQTIDLTKPFNTLTLLGYPSPGFPIRIVGEGDQQIMVEGKQLATHWITYSLEASGYPKSQKQVWRSEDVPVGGLVKEIQTSSYGGPSTVTLLEFGYANPEREKKASKIIETPPVATAEAWENSIEMKFQPVPSGAFTMGGMPKREFLRKAMDLPPDARLELLMQSPPQRSELIQQTFSVGAHEVTIGQFRQFVKATDYETDAEKDGQGGTGLKEDGTWGSASEFTWQEYGFEVSDDHPVANVSWNDAQAFCKWLSKMEGRSYRLPTEVEWEYACRGGTTTWYHTGDEPQSLDGFANMPDRSLAERTPELRWALAHDDGHPYLAPFGQFRPNSFGLYDMHGNVLEWCRNPFSPFDPLPEVEAPEPAEDRYVLRGGHWFGDPNLAGSASRSGAVPTHRMSLIGFRVVTEAGEMDNRGNNSLPDTEASESGNSGEEASRPTNDAEHDSEESKVTIGVGDRLEVEWDGQWHSAQIVEIQSAGRLRIRSLKLRSWGAEQAIGQPNTLRPGDHSTAWASRSADQKDEWLLLEYDRAVEPTAIVVHETYNPGAIAKISIVNEAGAEVIIWQSERVGKIDAPMRVLRAPVHERVTTRFVKVYLASELVPGWNEIDAVALVDRQGVEQWAIRANASSSYASGEMDPFWKARSLPVGSK